MEWWGEAVSRRGKIERNWKAICEEMCPLH